MTQVTGEELAAMQPPKPHVSSTDELQHEIKVHTEIAEVNLDKAAISLAVDDLSLCCVHTSSVSENLQVADLKSRQLRHLPDESDTPPSRAMERSSRGGD